MKNKYSLIGGDSKPTKQKLISRPMAGDELKKIIKNETREDINLIRYNQLHRYKDIISCLKNGVCVLLYESKQNSGHWCCIIVTYSNDGSKVIEFFDPYGMMIDDELKYIEENFKEKSNQEYPILTKMLYDCKYPISYNQYRFQKMGDNIATCGCWVICRILNKNMPLDEFYKVFSKYDDKQMSQIIYELL